MAKDVRLWVRDKGLYYSKHDRQHEFSCSHHIPLSLTGMIKVVLGRVAHGVGSHHRWRISSLGNPTFFMYYKQTCPNFAPERYILIPDSKHIFPLLCKQQLLPSSKAVFYTNILEKIIQTKNESSQWLCLQVPRNMRDPQRTIFQSSHVTTVICLLHSGIAR